METESLLVIRMKRLWQRLYVRLYRRGNVLRLRIYQQKWKQRNLAKRRGQYRRAAANQYAKDKHKILGRNAKYHARVRPHRLAYLVEWRKQHVDHARRIQKAWRELHSKQIVAKQRAWYQKNRLHAIAHRDRRRARLKGAEGIYTAADVERLFTSQQGRCFYCGKDLESFHVDHKIPISRGGMNSSENLCCACRWCNLSKSDRLISEWLGYLKAVDEKSYRRVRENIQAMLAVPIKRKILGH